MSAPSLGVSLGGTLCVVASRPDSIVADDTGARATPTAVSFSSDEWLTGAAARAAAVKHPKNTALTLMPLLSSVAANQATFAADATAPAKKGGGKAAPVDVMQPALHQLPAHCALWQDKATTLVAVEVPATLAVADQLGKQATDALACVTMCDEDGNGKPVNPPSVGNVVSHFLAKLKVLLSDAAGAGAVPKVVTVAVPRYVDRATLLRLAKEASVVSNDNTSLRFVADDVAALTAATVLAAKAKAGKPKAGDAPASPTGWLSGALNAGLSAVSGVLASPTAGDASATSCLPAPPADSARRVLRLVVDWGATGLSVSLLAVLGAGDAATFITQRVDLSGTKGGNALDNKLAAAVAELFKKKTKIDPMQDGRAHRKLLVAVERAKVALSVGSSAAVEVEALCDGIDCQEALSRTKLDMSLDGLGGAVALKQLIGAVLADKAAVDMLAGAGILPSQEPEEEDEEEEEGEEGEGDDEGSAEEDEEEADLSDWVGSLVGSVVFCGGMFRIPKAVVRGKAAAELLCPNATILTGDDAIGADELAAAGAAALSQVAAAAQSGAVDAGVTPGAAIGTGWECGSQTTRPALAFDLVLGAAPAAKGQEGPVAAIVRPRGTLLPFRAALSLALPKGTATELPLGFGAQTVDDEGKASVAWIGSVNVERGSGTAHLIVAGHAEGAITVHACGDEADAVAGCAAHTALSGKQLAKWSPNHHADPSAAGGAKDDASSTTSSSSDDDE